MVEIVLTKPDNFLILKETLTRIGLPNKDRTKLFQTCHILYKRQRYWLVHFKELFILDGKPTNFTITDKARRNSIINYLLELKFFTLASAQKKMEPFLPRNENNDDFTIISHDEKNVEKIAKYTIGSAKNRLQIKPSNLVQDVATGNG